MASSSARTCCWAAGSRASSSPVITGSGTPPPATSPRTSRLPARTRQAASRVAGSAAVPTKTSSVVCTEAPDDTPLRMWTFTAATPERGRSPVARLTRSTSSSCTTRTRPCASSRYTPSTLATRRSPRTSVLGPAMVAGDWPRRLAPGRMGSPRTVMPGRASLGGSRMTRVWLARTWWTRPRTRRRSSSPRCARGTWSGLSAYSSRASSPLSGSWPSAIRRDTSSPEPRVTASRKALTASGMASSRMPVVTP